MRAIRLLVRRSWRQHALASLLLAVVAGASAALVGASYQAADRAATSLARFHERSRVYDALVQGCPPGVDPSKLTSQTALLEHCVNQAVSKQLIRFLTPLPDIVRTSGSTTLVVGLLDRSTSNRWGRLGLMEATTSPGARLGRGTPIIAAGRNVDPNASDEIVLSETAARQAGLHAGDSVRMAGWRQADLDRAIDGNVRPQTASFRVKVVGVVRFLDDVQASGDVSLSDALLVGNVYAGSGWFRAHGADFSGYGSGVIVRLANQPGAAARVQRALGGAGWQTDVVRFSDTSNASAKNVIDIERRATLVFTVIAALASVAFIGVMLARQLRREAAEIVGVAALGMTRLQLRGLNAARALTISVPAAMIAAIGMILLSPFGPVGLARQLEFDTGFRVELIDLLGAGFVVVVFTTLGAIVAHGDAVPRRARSRASRITTTAAAIGPVTAVSAAVARGRSTRTAIAVTTLAIAGCLGAAGVVASYDRLVAVPEHYGAWWDVVVGQYSERAPFEAGVASLRKNRNVIAATSYSDETEIARIGGRTAWLIGTAETVGHRGPVMVSGRAARTDREVVLGRATAEELHKHVGDHVVLGSTLHHRVRLRVVGIAVVSDPIAHDSKPDEGVIVRFPVLTKVTRTTVPQSIVVALDPRRDRSRAIASLQRDFSGSLRAVVPPTDMRNLDRLRALPWLLAGLVAALALAALAHALFTILGRHRSTLAIVGALGFTRRQRRAVAASAGVGLTLIGIIIGVPVGLVLATRLWSAVANDLGLLAPTAWPWISMLVIPTVALIGAVVVATVAARGPIRVRPGQDLRVE